MKAILAMSQDDVIGDVDLDGSHFIPWSIPEDLKRFKELTLGHTVIMGRRTWESLPQKYRPLPGRQHQVLSRDPNFVLEGVTDPEAARVVTAEECIEHHRDAFVIGGREIYDLFAPYTEMAFVTHVNKDFKTETSISGPNLSYLHRIVFTDFQSTVDDTEHRSSTAVSITGIEYSYTTRWR